MKLSKTQSYEASYRHLLVVMLRGDNYKGMTISELVAHKMLVKSRISNGRIILCGPKNIDRQIPHDRLAFFYLIPVLGGGHSWKVLWE